ncbi:MAG: tetratricopeptide repeat protein [Planctomycetota bacterium]
MIRSAIGVLVLGWSLELLRGDVPWESVSHAEGLVAQGELREARRVYDEALARRPDSALLHLNRGIVRYRMGEREEVLADFECGTTAEREDVRFRSLFNKGRLLYDIASRSSPQHRTPGPFTLAEALRLLEASRQAFVEAVLVRPEDRDARESLEAVSQALTRWESEAVHEASTTAAGGARPDETGKEGGEAAGPGAAGGAEGSRGGRSRRLEDDAATPPAREVPLSSGRRAFADLDEGQLEELEQRLDELLERARSLKLGKGVQVRSRGERDW